MRTLHTAPPFILVVLLGTHLSAGEEKDPGLLNVDRIYGSGEFHSSGYSASWDEEPARYSRLESSSGPVRGREIVAYDAQSGEREVLVPASDFLPPGDTSPLEVDGYSWSEDRSLLLVYTNSRRVWRRRTRGDYWLLDRSSHELRKVGGDAAPSSLMFAKLSPRGTHAAYVRDNDLYVEDLREDRITALTSSGTDRIINGTFDWVYEEEFSLRDGFRWSPDGQSIAYWQIDSRGVRPFPLVNNTDTLYPRIHWIPYPKVGEKNSACRVGVVSVWGGETRWMDVPGDPRNNYIARMEWVPGTRLLLLQHLNRLQNTNRVLLADADTGEVKKIFTDRDDAWVEVVDELLWLEDGDRFTWISERDGWRHAYLVSRSTGSATLVTPGDYDVIRLLKVDEPRGWMYFLASPENPTQRYLYRIRLDGTGLERLTPADQPGTHSYQISADATLAIHRHSSFATPGDTELIRLPDHERIRLLADNDSLRKKLGKLHQGAHELFRVDIGDGVSLDGWCLKPPDFNPSRQYPLVFYVYGEPAGQTVRDSWGGSGHLWHLLLTQKGYIVMCFDNRGTPAPRGREWRKCVYRKVGIIAPQDQAAALDEVLRTRPWVDPDRIGIWGWSGGGSMSLNMIFKYPERYHTAVSIAPVGNQRYYDTIYQERYMGLPRDNVEGFLEGSPVTHAHKLEGNLLLIHGTGDDNCHYQGTEAVINELVRHNKPFSMMAYPNRSHSIYEGVNTTRHLRSLMLRYFLDNLPPGPRRRAAEL